VGERMPPDGSSFCAAEAASVAHEFSRLFGLPCSASLDLLWRRRHALFSQARSLLRAECFLASLAEHT